MVKSSHYRDWTTEHRLGKIREFHRSLEREYSDEWYDSLTVMQINAMYDDYLKIVSKRISEE